jgi:hypothetical protein
LQLLRSSTQQDSRQIEISKISADVKGLAKELNLPVIMVVQLSRLPDTDARVKEGHRPRLSDLREPGSIEQDADVVGLLVRPEYYEIGTQAGEATLIIAKQRNGPTGEVPLTFLNNYIRFETRARKSNYLTGSSRRNNQGAPERCLSESSDLLHVFPGTPTRGPGGFDFVQKFLQFLRSHRHGRQCSEERGIHLAPVDLSSVKIHPSMIPGWCWL